MSNRSIVTMPSLPLISASLDVGRITQHYEGGHGLFEGDKGPYRSYT